MLNNFINSLKIEKGYSPNTISAYQSDINQFLTITNKAEKNITKADVMSYLSSLTNKNLSASSISRKLTVVKEYYKFLNENNILNNPVTHIKTPKLNKRLPTYLTKAEVDKMIESSKNNKRHQLILTLLYYTGLRVSELCNLKFNNFEKDVLTVVGKGNKQRAIPVASDVKKLVSELPTNSERGDYILHSHTSSKKPITRDGVYKIIRAIGEKCGISKTKLHPHAFRHTTATHLLNKGVDIRVIQEVLGHSNLSTTAIYASVDMNNKIKAINVL